jgi:hypothetical protein
MTPELDKEEKKRTDQQRKALEVYCRLMAEKLNEAGLDMKVILKPEIDIPWTQESVKTHIWKPVLKAMENKTSTTEMITTNPTDILMVIDRFLAEKHGFYGPDWPSNR